MAYEVGASLPIRNNQQLTPLTLSAKLARIEMFFHIMNIEREIYWQIGSITCAAYPLGQVDTIDVNTGTINNNSALNLVVFGDKDEHLELMDGVLVDLLNAKWNTFIKSRFYRQFFLFCFYFVLSLISFTLRPGPSSSSSTQNSTKSTISYIDTSVTTDAITQDSSQLSQLIDVLATSLTSNFANVNLTSTELENFLTQMSSNASALLSGTFNTSKEHPTDFFSLHNNTDDNKISKLKEFDDKSAVTESLLDLLPTLPGWGFTENWYLFMD